MKIEEGTDYYFNDEGKMVLTAHYLLNRGYCCGNGCTHCPYHYSNVPEPKRTQLLKSQKDQEQNK